MPSGSGVNPAGILGERKVDPEDFVGWEVECEEQIPLGSVEGARPSPGKKMNFHLKWSVLMHCERYFCPCPRQQKCWIFRLKWYLMDVKVVFLENNEYSVRVMGLISSLLHYCIECKQSGAWNFETWQNLKGGHSLQILGTRPLVAPWFTSMPSGTSNRLVVVGLLHV